MRVPQNLVVVAAEGGIAGAGPSAAWLPVMPDDHVAAHGASGVTDRRSLAHTTPLTVGTSCSTTVGRPTRTGPRSVTRRDTAARGGAKTRATPCWHRCRLPSSSPTPRCRPGRPRSAPFTRTMADRPCVIPSTSRDGGRFPSCWPTVHRQGIGMLTAFAVRVDRHPSPRPTSLRSHTAAVVSTPATATLRRPSSINIASGANASWSVAQNSRSRRPGEAGRRYPGSGEA